MTSKGLVLLVVIIIGGLGYLFYKEKDAANYYTTEATKETVLPKTPTTTVTTETKVGLFPEAKNISGFSWVGQTFNNCSSVALMINLSYWGIVDTQEKIAEATRPWNNRNGNNDDKSVTLYELADYTNANYDLLTYVRPNGDIELLKKFIANDIPVLTRTLMYPKDDIVHYRVVKGYDEKKKIILQTDGVYGKEYKYTYDEWMHLWKDFNYSYLIVVPKEKQQLVERLLGEEVNEQIAWQNAKVRAEKELADNNSDLRAHYNVITARFYLGDYKGTIEEFEKIEKNLTRRKLWYQIEPIQAYFNLGQYDRVVELVDYIVNDNNKSVSELYVMKGEIYEKRGDLANARAEYQKAIFYNKHLKSAEEAIVRVGL